MVAPPTACDSICKGEEAILFPPLHASCWGRAVTWHAGTQSLETGKGQGCQQFVRLPDVPSSPGWECVMQPSLEQDLMGFHPKDVTIYQSL